MQNNIIIIYSKFKKIQDKGWIKSLRKGPTGIGYTFETLINKTEDTNPLPDFHGFEIKTIRQKSTKNIHLFNLTPECNNFNAIKKILNNLGYPSKSNPGTLSFCGEISTKEFRNIGYYKYVKLKVNYESEKIELIVYKYGKLCDLNVYWSFEYIKKRVYQKLKYLCVIIANNKFIENDEYFYYNKIYFYKLYGFKTFIKLIDLGIIKINFKVVNYSKDTIIDHGTDFNIKQYHLKYLYKKIEL